MEKFYHHFETIDSTSSWAKANSKSFAKDKLTIVSAEEQLRGYGQKRREWLAPKGEGLWASFCFYNEEADPLVLTRHMAENLLALLQERGVSGQIKWPNDIVVDGKKIAGILTEVVDNFVIIGIGVNVNMPKESLEKIDQPATSLLVETNKQHSAQELITALAEALSY